MKKVSFFAFALIFVGAIACNNPSSTEDATTETMEVVEEAAPEETMEVEEVMSEVADSAAEVMDTVMEAAGDVMEEMHDHADGEAHADHSDM
jgi:mevalonate kinase